MILKIIHKKYFISVLAILLVLSNFAFSAQFSICKMLIQDEDIACNCSHDEENNNSPSINRYMPCCISGTTELNNRNTLINLIDKNKVEKDVVSLIVNLDSVYDKPSLILSLNNIHPHKYSIPVFLSTLLI